LHPAEQLSIDGILGELAVFDGKYKRAEVNAAIAKRTEIVPRLIAVLEDVLENPGKVADNETLFAHVYGLMLLGHFRESRAHRVIIALCSLPDDLPYRLFGDLITEDLPVILLRTCNGTFEAIKALVQDRGADDYCRGAAATAITYGVVEGIMPREEALSFFGGLFNEQVADISGTLYDMIAGCVVDLYPEELMETIEAAYEKGLIHPGYISHDNIKRTLARGKERCLLDLQADLERRSLDDVHKSMSWWACFNESSRQWISPEPTSKNAAKSRNKKERRRIAKASRKVNRRKKK